MEQAMVTPQIKYTNLKKIFKNILLNSINEIKYKYSSDVSNKNILLIVNRLNSWSEKDSYMEHILMPRLNWLFDMNFIELKDDLSFVLTPNGILLLQCLNEWNAKAQHKIITARNYVNNYYLKIINDIFDFQKKLFNFASDNEFLEMYINKSFDLFKTLAPNRTTFSLAANYAKMMLFFKHSIVADENDICYYFQSKYNTKYIFKYQEQYKDGYIQKIIK